MAKSRFRSNRKITIPMIILIIIHSSLPSFAFSKTIIVEYDPHLDIIVYKGFKYTQDANGRFMQEEEAIEEKTLDQTPKNSTKVEEQSESHRRHEEELTPGQWWGCLIGVLRKFIF